MRQFIKGDGSDSTTATLTYLSSGRQFRFADLFLIGELEDPTSVFLTDWETPLIWRPWGTFRPASIRRDTITSKIGLEVDKMTIDWSPKLTVFTKSVASANAYQRGIIGFYANKKVRMWRAVMPNPGDCETYGACAMFGGRVAITEITRGQIKFTVNSFLDAINEKVPPNVIESTNTLAGYRAATPVLADSETIVAQFTVVAPSSQNNILAICTAPSAGKIYSNNKLRYGYIVFNPSSSLAGQYSAIAQNLNFNAGGGVHYNQFITYSSFPWAPSPGDTFFVSTQFPINIQDATVGGGYFGFPYCPQPESAF